MIKGVIFDLDGTLLDSMSIWHSVGVDYVIKYGYTPKPDLSERFTNMSMAQAGEYLKDEYDIPFTVQEIVDEINRMTEDFYLHRVQLKEGALDLLSTLRDRGIAMCIATATDRYLVEGALKKCGIDGYFSRIFTCTELGEGKSNPLVFRSAMEYLGTDRHSTVIVEDAHYAISSAKSDGFKVVGIYDRHEQKQDEIKSLADVYLTGYLDLTDFWKLIEE
jgi:HAD superfamily hydrolase (TIGR01509 family)